MSSSSSAGPLEKKRRTINFESLLACGFAPKQVLAKVLTLLKDDGLFAEDVDLGDEQHTRRQFSYAQSALAKTMTPYGQIVSTFLIDFVDKPNVKVEFVNPFAWIWYLSSICPEFVELMQKCVPPSSAGRVIFYADEIKPGNVLTPDKGRNTMCLYWGYLDWPEHVMCRADAWFTFTCIRSTQIERIDGPP